MIEPVKSSERKIWWLASYPKSGNTWIRLFLNAYVSGFPLDLNSAFQFAFNDLTSQVVQITAARPLDRLTLEEQAYYRPGTLVNFLNLYASRDIVLKTHNAKVAINDIPLCPHQLSRGAVYVIRDPRDVAISFADHTGEDLDVAVKNMGNIRYALKNKDSMYHLLLTWTKHVTSWTEVNEKVPFMVLRYEDMLEDPVVSFRKVVMFMKLPRDEKKLHFAIDQTKFDNLKKFEEEHGFIEVSDNSKTGRFFRVGKAGQWKEVLTEEQVAQIEKDHGQMMKKHGYELVTQ